MLNIENALSKNKETNNLRLLVTSGAELARAIQAEYPRDQIVYNSDRISLETAQMAVSHGIGRIIVYGTEELKIIEKVCKEKSQKVNALLHLPTIGNNILHEFISIENSDFSWELDQNPDRFSSVFRNLLCSQYVNLLGFHFHMDSRFSDEEACQNITVALRDLIDNLKQLYGFNTAELNIGGSIFQISRENGKLS